MFPAHPNFWCARSRMNSDFELPLGQLGFNIPQMNRLTAPSTGYIEWNMDSTHDFILTNEGLCALLEQVVQFGDRKQFNLDALQQLEKCRTDLISKKMLQEDDVICFLGSMM